MSRYPKLFCLSLLSLTMAAVATAAPPPDLAAHASFNIAPQKLATALVEFSRQANTPVVSATGEIERFRSPGVKGKMSLKDALKALLAGTSLDGKLTDSGAIAVGSFQAAPAAGEGSRATSSLELRPVGELVRLAELEALPAASVNAPLKREEQTETQATEVEVTGSRIRTLVGEQAAQPVLSITREDIERYGVSSLGELFRFIPQVTSSEIGQVIQPVAGGTPAIGATANRVSATLRGAPPGGTLLLVNGRRVPKTGQAGQAGGLADNEAYDLGGIPLSAIERVDVLLDGASAIYGADAVGGVINVILRRSYNGTEARASYENTFDSDVSVKNLSLTHGFALGRFSAMAMASWEDGNALKWADRDFLRTFDRRFLGGPDLRTANLFAGRGTLSSLTTANLPGLNTTQVAIPAGSDGRNVTVADYANSGPLPPLYDTGDYAIYTSPYRRKTLSASADYQFSSLFTAFAEARWNESQTEVEAAPFSGASLTLPVGAPGNPFPVAVRLRKFFYDLPTPRQEMTNEDDSVIAGLRGELPGDWRYEASAQQVRGKPELFNQPTGINATVLAAAFAGPNPPVLAYDSTTGIPRNPAGALEALTVPSPTAERSRTRTYDMQANGKLFGLPAGDVRVSIGTEYREEHVDFPIVATSVTTQEDDRYVLGSYAEMRVPLISGREGWPLLNKLEASLAVRHDSYSDFDSSVSPRYSLMYRPVHWIMLRGSYGEGYKVPTLLQLYRPTQNVVTFLTPGSVLDAFRGNEAVVSPPTGLPVVRRGNPNLNAEQSENFSAGLVLDVPVLRGLSLSLDYFDTRYLDRVGSVSLSDRIILFPESVTRGPKLSSDPAEWLGPVIGYNEISFNVAFSRISGYDLGLKYRYPTERGEWSAQASASKTTHNEIRTRVTLPPSFDSTAGLPLQATAMLGWARQAFKTSVVWSYRDTWTGTALIIPTTVPSKSPPITRWDWQGAYSFGGGTRVSLTIFNVLNRDPVMRTGIMIPDNAVLDARLRRYSISLTREF